MIPGLLLLVLAVPGVVARPADPGPVLAVPELAPAVQYQKLDQVITGLLSHYHYRQSRLDNALSAAVFDAYLEALDFNRSYFLAGDIARFERYRHALDEYLQDGNLWPAYEIFNAYQRRLAERTVRIQQQLRQPVDFTVSESVDLDRKDARWMAGEAELDEFWRKRLKHELLTLVLAGKPLDEARDTLERRYVGRQRRTAQTTSDDVFQIYMNAVAQSFDPHTAYLSPRNTENFNIQMRLSLEGIGAVLRMEDEQTTVVELVPGGPADLSKQMKPNDKIIAVGQGNDEALVDVIGWRLDDVVDLIRGPRGTVVRLQVVPAEAGADTLGKTVRLVRDTIRLEEQAAKSEVRAIPGVERNYKIGIITIPTFYIDFAAAQRGDPVFRSTTRDVRRLLTQLKASQVDGVVVDLRQNGGGSLQEAVDLTGLFIPEGPVVQIRGTKGDVEVEKDPDPSLVYDGPLAVLVDRFSASASEIFAGAIQDYGRGIVLGEPTFGKGTVQTLVDLNRYIPRARNEMGQLKLTVAKFYRINGSSTQHRGVHPDIAFPSVFSADEVGESAQQHALPWDEIRPIRYQPSRQLAALIPRLESRHQSRMTGDPQLRKWLKDLEEARQSQDQTVVSLVESERRAERDQAQNRLLERINVQRAAEGLEPLMPAEELDGQEEPDLLLDEAAHIMTDMLDLLAQENGRAGKAVVMTGG
ncbi:MAG: carboxy terminal-processing peptidase [Pseudomonadota bacterium]|nr:carboxy terminal-processing peptidase [Pseudomonadota bacterium]